MTPIEILETAATLIDKHGHAKWLLRDMRGRLCAQGAMLTAYHGRASWPGSVDLLVHDLPRAAKELYSVAPELYKAMHGLQLIAQGPINDWNNAPKRKRGEVTSAMRAAAAIMRAKQQEQFRTYAMNADDTAVIADMGDM